MSTTLKDLRSKRRAENALEERKTALKPLLEELAEDAEEMLEPLRKINKGNESIHQQVELNKRMALKAIKGLLAKNKYFRSWKVTVRALSLWRELVIFAFAPAGAPPELDSNKYLPIYSEDFLWVTVEFEFDLRDEHVRITVSKYRGEGD